MTGKEEQLTSFSFDNNLNKSNLREKGFILAYRSKVQSIAVGMSREEEHKAGSWLRGIYSQEAEL